MGGFSGIGDLISALGGDIGQGAGDVWSELGNVGWPSSGQGGGAGWNWGTLIPAGLLGAGFIGNYQQQSRINQLNNLLSNPAAMAHYIQAFSHPLAAGAVAAARNAAQASLGERGLSQSPAQSAAVYAQALSPLYAQQQSQAEQAAMSALGAREQLLSGQHPANLFGPLAALMQRFQRPTGDPNDPTNTVPTNIGAPTFPTPGMDLGYDNVPAPLWDPANTANPGFQQPDWASILGGAPQAPLFDFGNLPPAFSNPLGGG